jgi:hypothetical protein
MRINNRLTAAFACYAILAPVMLSEAMAKPNRTHQRAAHREHIERPAGCPVHTNANGELIDCHGWRKWSGSIGWDNTCFRSLPNLPGQYACSPSGW